LGVVATIDDVRQYWERHIHDFDVTSHAPGSRGFFEDLDAYHFEKLHHLPRLIDFARYEGRRVLDVGCGAGVDLARFAKAGAVTVGVDIAASAIELARTKFRQQGLSASSTSPTGAAAVSRCELRPPSRTVSSTPRIRSNWSRVSTRAQTDGEAIFRVQPLLVVECLVQVDERGLSMTTPVLLEVQHREFQRLVAGFRDVRIVPERFPVHSRLHKGWKGAVYNRLFVGTFNALPRPLVERFGWHLLAFCRK
jgi:hypothetical protein